MAHGGAKVMHAPAAELAMHGGVPLRVRNTFSGAPGHAGRRRRARPPASRRPSATSTASRRCACALPAAGERRPRAHGGADARLPRARGRGREPRHVHAVRRHARLHRRRRGAARGACACSTRSRCRTRWRRSSRRSRWSGRGCAACPASWRASPSALRDAGVADTADGGLAHDDLRARPAGAAAGGRRRAARRVRARRVERRGTRRQ